MENMNELTDADLDTWSAFATVLEWLPAALDDQLQRDAGLNHFEYGLLYALERADERRLRMSELAAFSNSSFSRLSHAVKRLERGGWVRREPDPGDRRATLAILTAAGFDKVRSATPGHVALVRTAMLDRLTAAQARQLREISDRIQRGIREEVGWSPRR